MLRIFALIASFTYLLLVALLVQRTLHFGELDLPGLPPIPLAMGLLVLGLTAVGFITLIVLHVTRRRTRDSLTWVLLVPLVAGLVGVSWRLYRTESAYRDRAAGNTKGIYSRSMRELESHEFALRLVASALSDQGETSDGTLPEIPEDWPLPPDFTFAVTDAPGTAQVVWSHHGDETCRMILNPAWWLEEPGMAFACDETGPRPRTWHPVVRAPLVQNQPQLPPDPVNAWPQYRRDPMRTGQVRGSSGGAPFWRADLGGSARSSVSVGGSLVLIGAHGTGTLEAHDRSTGRLLWRVREPNWIHQDPVTDGSLVFVGFGDNSKSLQGAAPSGVAAHEIRTGRRLWTRFLDNSVMTTPAVLDSLVIFGTAKGDVFGVDRRTGYTRWTRHLPGNIVMAPPLLVGTTVIVSLDPRGMCAVEGTDGTMLWCATLPRRMAEAGHISPTETGGRIFGTANVLGTTSEELILRNGLRSLPSLWRRYTEGKPLVVPHQESFALDFHDGSLVWTSRLDNGECCAKRTQRGHMSGTPAVVPQDSSLVVVSPFSDRVYRLDEETGAILARSEPIPIFPRGPALVVDSTVIAVDRQGMIHVLATEDLHETCALPLGEPVDRAGPTLAEGSLLIAGREGGLYSIPVHDVLRCDLTLSERIARLKQVSVTGG